MVISKAKINLTIIITILLFLITLQCGNNPKSRSAVGDKIQIYAGIEPLAYFVECIGGDYVEVKTLMPPGQDPHLFQPTPKQMVALEKTKLLFKLGLPFENHLVAKISKDNRQIAFVDVTEGVALRPVQNGHGHNNNSEHTDPHIWLGTRQIRKIVMNIAQALVDKDPFHADYYGGNLVAFLKKLDTVHNSIARSLSPFDGQKIFVFHPSFGYFTDTYGLKEEPIEEMGKSPSPKQLSRIISLAKKEGVRVIFVQPEFDVKNAEVIAEAIGGSVVSLNPLAKDVLQNLQNIAQKIENALKKPLIVNR